MRLHFSEVASVFGVIITTDSYYGDSSFVQRGTRAPE